MTQATPSIVWRADIAGQRVVRDSSLQANTALRDATSAMNWWGGPGVIWFAIVVWFGSRALRRRAFARVGYRGAEALALASGVSGIIKGFAGRARPFVTPGEPWHWEFNRGWSEAQFFSMPSGHTTATSACVVAMTLAMAGWRPATRWMVAAPLLASALAVAFARMYADQHWLSDVVVAAMLGAGVSTLLARVHAAGPHPRYEHVMLGPDVGPTR